MVASHLPTPGCQQVQKTRREAWGAQQGENPESKEGAEAVPSQALQEQRRDQVVLKARWVSEGHKVKARLRAAERELETLLSVDNGHATFAEMAEVARVDTLERQKLEKGLGERLRHVRHAVLQVQSLISCLEGGEAQDVRSLAELMDQAETDITALKEEQCQLFDTLDRAEKAFTRELDLFVQRLVSWESQEHEQDEDDELQGISRTQQAPMHAWSTRLAKQQKGAGKGQHGLLQEVQEFDEFVQRTGGETGGWEPLDHKRFLRILTEHQGDYSLVVEPALSELLLFDRAAIIAHCRWHAEYEDLLRRKRAAIVRWRVKKEAEREEARQAALVEAESVRAARAERQEHVLMEQQEREERQRQLQAWKKAREEEEAERKAAEAAERERRQQEESLKKQKQAQVKGAVLAFKAAQRAEEERRKQQEAQEEERRRRLRTPTEEDLQRRRERDRMMVEAKRAAEAAKEAMQKEKEARLERLRKQVEVHVDRDPHRLLKVTKAVEGRKQTDENDATNGGRLFDQKVVNPRVHQTRAMPSWRQPLRG